MWQEDKLRWVLDLQSRLGPAQSVLIREVSSSQGFCVTCIFGTKHKCGTVVLTVAMASQLVYPVSSCVEISVYWKVSCLLRCFAARFDFYKGNPQIPKTAGQFLWWRVQFVGHVSNLSVLFSHFLSTTIVVLWAWYTMQVPPVWNAWRPSFVDCHETNTSSVACAAYVEC